jgi:hypothetical protein
MIGGSDGDSGSATPTKALAISVLGLNQDCRDLDDSEPWKFPQNDPVIPHSLPISPAFVKPLGSRSRYHGFRRHSCAFGPDAVSLAGSGACHRCVTFVLAHHQIVTEACVFSYLTPTCLGAIRFSTAKNKAIKGLLLQCNSRVGSPWVRQVHTRSTNFRILRSRFDSRNHDR